MRAHRSSRADYLRNSQIAELLALESEISQPPLQRALRTASRSAILWPEEASDIAQQSRSLTELKSIGPSIEKRILRWIESPPLLTAPPDIRSGFRTMTEARAIVQENPDWSANLKGDLQMHTNWSDGEGSVEDMALAGAQRNYEYISITDHSKGLKIAAGIDEAQLRKQGQLIDELNASLRQSNKSIQLLRSIELNINPTGEGDMSEDALDELDIVLGCFHSSLRTKADQTERYLAALRNPSIQILGHPRGRVYNYRLGLTADWSRVFALAAELDKAVEIDAYPDRQDLSPDLLLLAKKAGCRISLGTDSHGPLQLRFMDFSLASAIDAGISGDRILNFMSRNSLVTWARNVRSTAKRAA